MKRQVLCDQVLHISHTIPSISSVTSILHIGQLGSSRFPSVLAGGMACWSVGLFKFTVGHGGSDGGISVLASLADTSPGVAFSVPGVDTTEA